MPSNLVKPRAVGVIVEYNPFHNGHLYHLNQAKQETGADVIIAVMSGSFLQRGEPALLSKWSRTNMALAHGVDLVLELPYAYAVQKAELFAHGAISILAAAQADYVHFGSESGSIDDFYSLHSFMQENKVVWDDLIKQNMKQGYSYPKAASLAFLKLNATTALSLDQPNNILGYHYVKSIFDQNAQLTPCTTKRQAAGYHDKDLSQSSIASATSIRHTLTENENDAKQIKRVMPKASYQELQSYFSTYQKLHTWELYFPYLQYRVLSSTSKDLSEIYECEEGLEHRIQETIATASTFKEWMTALKTKRYTWTRLQRLATHMLTNTTKDEINQIHTEGLPYIRPLGMNSKGQAYLRYLKKQVDLPILNRFASISNPMSENELKASRSYAIPLTAEHRTNRFNEDFYAFPIRVD